jgi:predicted nucleic acid-binding protein
VVLVYLDASAIVKLLVEEDGSDLAAELWDGCDAPVSCRPAYLEVRATLAPALRNHDLGTADVVAAEGAFEAYWSSVRPVELSQSIARHAAQLASHHGGP